MVVRVIDIETTGIEPENDAIIEFASVDLVRSARASRTSSSMM
jgi:DNA polymerase III epsilon subunit-like protein